MKKYRFISKLNNQHGVTAIVVAICLFALIAFVSLAIDVGHLYVAKNELQNAADAGALAGALNLFTEDMQSIQTIANQFAFDAAIANIADGNPVDVLDPLSNNGDVQRGHWSLLTRTFTPNSSLAVLPLLGKSTTELDTDTNFINAVRVAARRDNKSITAFFASVLGFSGFTGIAEAVAYVGFAGSETTKEIDQPIAICAQSVVGNPAPFDPTAPPPDPCWESANGWADCSVSCSSGTMLDSGTDAGQPTSTHNTAAWINFTTSDGSGPCDTADASDMQDLVCKGEGGQLPTDVSQTLSIGDYLGATGGVQASTYNTLKNCWKDPNTGNCINYDYETETCTDFQPLDSDSDTIPDHAWNQKLPVVDCPGNNVSNCPKMVGVICVNLVWMTGNGTPDPSLETPYKMSAEIVTEVNGTQQKTTKTWNVADGTDQPYQTFAELQTYLQSKIEPGQNTEIQKYFQSEQFTCYGTLPGWATMINSIPAPLAMDAASASLPVVPDSTGGGNIFANKTVQVDFESDFLNNTQDPGTTPYNKDRICTPEDLLNAFEHRQADAAGMGRWYSFIHPDKGFGLLTYDGRPASLKKKTIYYLPNCACEDAGKGTGGLNFGVLARKPVLVR